MTIKTNTLSGTNIIQPSVGLPEVSIEATHVSARLESGGNGGTLLFIHEIGGAGGFEQLGGQTARLAAILGERQHMIDQIARLAAAHRDVPWPVIVVEQIVDDFS